MKFTYSDAAHAYTVDGRRVKSVTTVAKIPDDDYALREWQKRQVAIGLAMSEDLRDKVAAHYTDKNKLRLLCEEAMNLAGATKAAGRGTAAHRITEGLDLGEPIIDTPLSGAVRAAWLESLGMAGLRVMPEYVERFVLWPDEGIAGKFDRVVCEQADPGHMYILDLKTGDGALRYPHAIAVQLGLYAHAPLVATGGQWFGDQYETEEFEPWPPAGMDMEVGYVLHMTGEGTSVVPIDIGSGVECYREGIKPVLRWRARRDLVGQERSTPPPVVPVGRRALEYYAQDAPPTREELLASIKALPPEAQAQVKARWPVGVASLRNDPGPDETGRAAVAALVDSVREESEPTEAPVALSDDPLPPLLAPEGEEAIEEAPGPPEGTEEATSAVVVDIATGQPVTARAFQLVSYADWDRAWPAGTDTATDEQRKALREAFGGLTPELRNVVNRWVQEGNEARVEWGDLASHPTVRRICLGHAAVGLARAFDGDEELARAAIVAAIGGVPWIAGATVGEAIGRLTRDQARDALALALAYSGDSTIIKFTPDGPEFPKPKDMPELQALLAPLGVEV